MIERIARLGGDTLDLGLLGKVDLQKYRENGGVFDPYNLTEIIEETKIREKKPSPVLPDDQKRGIIATAALSSGKRIDKQLLLDFDFTPYGNNFMEHLPEIIDKVKKKES